MNILITGANRGIGAALLAAAQSRGDTAFGTTRSAGHDTLLPLDVRDPASCAALADTFATNVTGVYLTAMAFLPHLKQSKTPKLAIISSQMGSNTRAKGQSYIYRASKSAALNLGRNLAVDLKPQGIPVGIYHPGWVRTDMGTDAADIGTEDSARGLLQRFDALSLETTGCFEMWNGDAMPL
jgi:NAD(P)-dependent dehydrogenase (short-subunit alcohol dehydrogenase family)